MFGIGGSEILVILVVALLFLGPEKLPDAAKQISKGIRDLRKQSRALQQTIEDDEHIGGAIRDLKSALRGEDPPNRYSPPLAPKRSDNRLAQVDPEYADHHDADHHDHDADHHDADHHDHDTDHHDHDTGHIRLEEAGSSPVDPEPTIIKPPPGETAPRNPPDQDLDTAPHKHG